MFSSYRKLKRRIEDLLHLNDELKTELQTLQNLVHQIQLRYDNLQYRAITPTKLTMCPRDYAELNKYYTFHELKLHKHKGQKIITTFLGMDVIADDKIEGWYLK